MKSVVIKTIVFIDGEDCGTLKSCDFSECIEDMILNEYIDNDNDSIVDQVAQEWDEGGL